MPNAIETYLKNREDYYTALFPRIPHTGFRDALKNSIHLHLADVNTQVLQDFNNENSAFQSLALNDWLKKPAFGKAMGRTAISVESALERALELEQIGILFFQLIVNNELKEDKLFRSLLESCKTTHSELLKLTDDLRYYRVRLGQ